MIRIILYNRITKTNKLVVVGYDYKIYIGLGVNTWAQFCKTQIK